MGMSPGTFCYLIRRPLRSLPPFSLVIYFYNARLYREINIRRLRVLTVSSFVSLVWDSIYCYCYRYSPGSYLKSLRSPGQIFLSRSGTFASESALVEELQLSNQRMQIVSAQQAAKGAASTRFLIFLRRDWH